MTRAMRRHHKQRVYDRTKKLLKDYWGRNDLAEEHDRIRKLQDNFSVCSCYMCRNPRRNKGSTEFERTMQERRTWSVHDLPLTYAEEEIMDADVFHELQMRWHDDIFHRR